MIYVKGKELLQEMLLSKQQDKLTPKAQQMFILIADRIGRKFRYNNPIDREDCVQTACLDMFANWRNFDPKKSNNAFAYVTEIAKRGYARSWRELYHQKGNQTGINIPHYSIESINNGTGLYTL